MDKHHAYDRSTFKDMIFDFIGNDYNTYMVEWSYDFDNIDWTDADTLHYDKDAYDGKVIIDAVDIEYDEDNGHWIAYCRFIDDDVCDNHVYMLVGYEDGNVYLVY